MNMNISNFTRAVWGVDLYLRLTYTQVYTVIITDITQVIMTLHGSDNYRFVVVEEYGFVRSYDPRTLSGDVQIMVWVGVKVLCL
jgi:hypothetical protein